MSGHSNKSTSLEGLSQNLPVLIHPSELMRMNFIRAEKLRSEANGLISIERLAGVDHHREKPRVGQNEQTNSSNHPSVPGESRTPAVSPRTSCARPRPTPSYTDRST